MVQVESSKDAQFKLAVGSTGSMLKWSHVNYVAGRSPSYSHNESAEVVGHSNKRPSISHPFDMNIEEYRQSNPKIDCIFVQLEAILNGFEGSGEHGR